MLQPHHIRVLESYRDDLYEYGSLKERYEKGEDRKILKQFLKNFGIEIKTKRRPRFSYESNRMVKEVIYYVYDRNTGKSFGDCPYIVSAFQQAVNYILEKYQRV